MTIPDNAVMLDGKIRFETLDALEAFLDLMQRTPSAEADGISEMDHGLQCAAELRVLAPGDEELQVAGLLHDVGHHISHIREHDAAGRNALADIMSDRVARLVGLHVAAKRYLVTTDPSYRALLSPTSIKTLALQGGDMSPAEVAAFEAQPHWQESLLLRRADEGAKTPGRAVPTLADWLPAIRRYTRRTA
jgi:predicted HD phosphohydrolase